MYYQMVGGDDTSSGQILAVVTLHVSLNTGVKIPHSSLVRASIPSSPPVTAGVNHSKARTPAIFILLHVIGCLPSHAIARTHVRPGGIHNAETEVQACPCRPDAL